MSIKMTDPRGQIQSAQNSSQSQSQSQNRAGFYSTMRASDVFLTCFPKSGITWLGFLIAHVMRPQETDGLDLKSFNRCLPDVNDAYATGGPLSQYADFLDPRFFVCNANFDAKFPRVVYMVRDPRDVMVSLWHHHRYHDRDFSTSLLDFIRDGARVPCEWDQHVAGWMLPPKHPNMLIIRYEDLHKNAAVQLRKVLNFAGITDISDSRIEAAVEASRFERMRAAEDKFKRDPQVGNQHERLVRIGRVGNWQEEMNYNVLKLAEEKYGKIMRQIGYEPLS